MEGLIATTDRLIIRKFNLEDAPFILRLLNTPNWIRYIGDRNVNNIDEAREYLLSGPLKNYNELGFGLFGIIIQDTLDTIGTSGFLKRPYLENPDIGFAILPEYYRKGFTAEAVKALLQYGKTNLGFKKVSAITAVDNMASINLLLKLKFEIEQKLEREGQVINLFQKNL